MHYFFLLLGLFLGQKTFPVKENRNEEETNDCKNRNNDKNSNTDRNGNRNNEIFFTWKSMLSVLASLAPKQLQKLDSIINNSLSNNVALSWCNFGGYNEEKKLLQKILKISKIEKITIADPEPISPQKNKSENNSQKLQNKLSEPKISLAQSLNISSEKVRGIVLYGPSGCGKSYLAKIIAAEVIYSQIDFY